MTDHIEKDTEGHLDTGMMETPYLLKLLSKYGRPDLACTLMNQKYFPSFGYEIIKGAITPWETWEEHIRSPSPSPGMDRESKSSWQPHIIDFHKQNIPYY